MIPIDIRSRSKSLNHEISLFSRRRVSFALDRFRNPRRVIIFLEDVNGPKGGPDKLCRIIAEFGFASVVVEEIQSEWHVAISLAIHRVAHKLACKLARNKHASPHSTRRSARNSIRLQEEPPE